MFAHEFPDFLLEFLEKRFGAFATLELGLEFLGNTSFLFVTGSGFGCGGGLAGVFGLGFVAEVPEGGEVVGDAVDGVGGVDFPVGGEGRLGVGDVEETIWRGYRVSIQFCLHFT